MQTDAHSVISRTYQKEFHISWKKPDEGGKLIILNLTDGDFYSLEDPVSIKIWELLMAGLDSSAITEELTKSHSGQSPEAIAEDTRVFIQQLLENRLICPCPIKGVKA